MFAGFGGLEVKKGPKGEQETEPERIYKLKQCADILVAAGYSRARIPSLSPFDKVVGGMCWSITAAAVELNVDILFQENSTIGQRIKLSESLVKAMLQMKCPFPVQPQQIQGLDYDKLFPAIQWLVGAVLRTRAEQGDQNRLLSLQQFGKHYAGAVDRRAEAATVFLNTVLETYAPSRKFKKRGVADFESEVARTEATLLEYGERIYRPSTTDEESRDAADAKRRMQGRGVAGKLDAAAASGVEEEKKRKQEEAERKAQDIEQKRLDAIKQQLAAVEGEGGKVSGSAIGGLMGAQADEIARAEQDLRRLEEEALTGAADKTGAGKRGAQQAHERMVANLTNRVEQETAKLKAKMEVYQAQRAKLLELKTEVQDKTQYAAQIETATAKLEAIENAAENQEILKTLRSLVLLNETLKLQESQFKESCKRQREDLMEMLKKLETGDNDEETKRMLEVEKLHSDDTAKLDKIRAALAKLNQQIAKYQREIDDLPTNAELMQYERRFVELYELVADKLIETRKYFAMYNTLEDSHSFMTNEVTLLNSIHEAFPGALKAKPAGQQQFLDKFNQILDGVEKTKDQRSKELEFERAAMEALNQKYNKLMERQRAYFKAVKEFQEECYKNEKLQEAVTQLR